MTGSPMNWLRVSVVSALIVLTIGGALAPSVYGQSADDPSPHSDGRLISEVSAIAPGEPFTVGLHLQMEEGWHSYWKNPGDSGEPTSVDWSLPPGFEAGEIQWPYPHRIPYGPMTSYGYSDEVVLPIQITPPDTISPGTRVTVRGRANWLICEEICLPAHADIETSLDVAESARSGPGAEAIADARSKHPETVDGWTVEAARSSGSYTLAVTPPQGHSPDLEGAQFFPTEKEVLDHAAPQPLSRAENARLIALQQSSYADEPVDTLRGVLVAPQGTSLDSGGQVRAMRVAAPVDSTLSSVATTVEVARGGGDGLSLHWALLFAFIGGLLLNLMPCVFPVISVKILGFAEQAGEEDHTIRKHGFLFGTGVLVSMWILAGILIAVRAAGAQVGWGFQLQSPVFIAFMALLFFGIGLNLLGLFEVGTRLMSWGGQLQTNTSDGSLGAFMTGVLATVVATPCTAPFMGAALGVALTMSTVGALLIFSALGAGMATPYVGLSMAPGLLEALPEPGAWMESLKQFFAFPMFATAIWLVWVFGQQTGNGGVAFLLGGLLLLGMAGWIVHRWSAPTLSSSVLFATRGLVAVMIVGAVGAGMLGAGYERTDVSTSAETSEGSATTNWTTFSPETVDELRSEGPVFVDFTAAWCLTCQVNEQTVLNTNAVQSAFEQHDVALVKADWTNRDPQITKALESHGRSGVPVYVLYPGDGSGPTLLPEVLTEQIVLDALDDLPSSS